MKEIQHNVWKFQLFVTNNYEMYYFWDSTLKQEISKLVKLIFQSCTNVHGIDSAKSRNIQFLLKNLMVLK